MNSKKFILISIGLVIMLFIVMISLIYFPVTQDRQDQQNFTEEMLINKRQQDDSGINDMKQKEQIVEPVQIDGEIKPTIITTIDLIKVSSLPLGSEQISPNSPYWRKNSKLFYKHPNGQIYLIPKVDGKNISVMLRGPGTFKDNKYVYFFYCSDCPTMIKRLEGVDTETFGYFDGGPLGSLVMDSKALYYLVYSTNGVIDKVPRAAHIDIASVGRVPCNIPKVPEKSCKSNLIRDTNGVYNTYTDNLPRISLLDPIKTSEVIYPPSAIMNDSYADTDMASDGYSFLRDDNTIYRIYGTGKLVLYPGADVDSFEVLSYEYQKDDHKIFYFDPDFFKSGSAGTEAMEVKNADTQSFEIVHECSQSMGGTEYFARDKNYIYGRENKLPINATAFQILGWGMDGPESSVVYSTDGNNIYRGCGATILSMDPDTFQIVGMGQYLKDKNFVYNHIGELIKGINPSDCTEDKLESCHL